MKTSANGISFIKIMEGVRHKAYRDSNGHLTIGVGHLLQVQDESLTWDDDKINAALVTDLETAEMTIMRLNVPFSQPQFDALVSFVFNIGVGAFGASTAAKMLKISNYLAAADSFLLWDSHGILLQRRQAERGIFLYGTATGVSDAAIKH